MNMLPGLVLALASQVSSFSAAVLCGMLLFGWGTPAIKRAAPRFACANGATQIALFWTIFFNNGGEVAKTLGEGYLGELLLNGLVTETVLSLLAGFLSALLAGGYLLTLPEAIDRLGE